MGQENCHPEAGDLIEIDRKFYQHWALYLGDGYVINVTPVDEGAPSLSVSTVSIFTRRARVKKQLLKEVVGNDQWQVNNKYDRSRTPLPVQQILWRAERWIDKEVVYDVLGSNCEHFVTMLRYGEGVSEQVTNAVVGTTTAAVGGVILAGLAAVVLSGFSGNSSKEERE